VGRGLHVSAHLGRGKIYFSFVVDVYSRMIVGWQFATHMRTDLVLDALRMALSTRQPGADFTLVAHTDQGSQYVSEDYTQQLDDAKVLASVGTVGDAYDNRTRGSPPRHACPRSTDPASRPANAP
jgi:transposase InsO family protein